ncbi:calcium-binding protein [Metapseudomonas otitidis]|uniref:calcium-binding protein n=1 Tax=Metapseudomonas otitidis TaxID=319939 RepID=UPI0013F695B2|nr:calcium-binding protein [Pseudomonas otitidis]
MATATTPSAATSGNLYVGGKGNDVLNGTVYRDTYFFELGDGHDVINEVGGEDVLRFGPGISAQDVEARKVGSDIVFVHSNGTDSITLKNAFSGNN